MESISGYAGGSKLPPELLELDAELAELSELELSLELVVCASVELLELDWLEELEELELFMAGGSRMISTKSPCPIRQTSFCTSIVPSHRQVKYPGPKMPELELLELDRVFVLSLDEFELSSSLELDELSAGAGASLCVANRPPRITSVSSVPIAAKRFVVFVFTRHEMRPFARLHPVQSPGLNWVSAEYSKTSPEVRAPNTSIFVATNSKPSTSDRSTGVLSFAPLKIRQRNKTWSPRINGLGSWLPAARTLCRLAAFATSKAEFTSSIFLIVVNVETPCFYCR